MRVLFFGQLADITDCSVIQLSDIQNTDALESVLHERYPALRQAKYITTINRQIIRQHMVLSEDVEVALLPPFSGG